jgi:hypothetical protein
VQSSKSGFVQILDGLLRGRAESLEKLTPVRALVILLVCGGFYGAVMGSFWGDSGPRLLQMQFSALKVPILLGVTALLSLPTFFVVSTLVGLRDDFAESMKALMVTQGVLVILLVSFAPFTLLWYASTASYSSALLFNGAMFGLASLFAQRVLARLYRPLIERDARHRMMIRIWLITYAFVGIQMGWVLRPFIGDPDRPTSLFRQEAWGNAYEVLGQHLQEAVRR